MLPAMIALVAAYVPSHIHTALKHPMLVAIKIWALAHLLANGDLASLVLFGSFLAFAVYDRISVKRRAAPGPLGTKTGPVAQRRSSSWCVGTALYLLFLLWLHQLLIGVSRRWAHERWRAERATDRHRRARAAPRAHADARGARSSRPAPASRATIKGIKYPRRGVTVLAREAWEAALAELGDAGDLDWTARRANLLVEGVGAAARVGRRRAHRRRRDRGHRTRRTPCRRMEEAQPGPPARALSRLARRHHRARARRRARHARRRGRGPGVAARAQDQAARLSGTRPERRRRGSPAPSLRNWICARYSMRPPSYSAGGAVELRQGSTMKSVRLLVSRLRP